MKTIKQYGLQRSGTNYTKLMLTTNYKVDIKTNEGGWKHGYVVSRCHFNKELDLIITIKNPYAWLVSIYNYFHPSGHNTSISKFIRNKYCYEGMVNKTPIHHWNTMNKHWCHLMLLNHKVVVVMYEDLLCIPEYACNLIADQLNLERKSNSFYIPQNQVMANAKENDKLFDKSYYLEKKYLNQFTSDDLEYIQENLDSELYKEYYL